MTKECIFFGVILECTCTSFMFNEDTYTDNCDKMKEKTNESIALDCLLRKQGKKEFKNFPIGLLYGMDALYEVPNI